MPGEQPGSGTCSVGLDEAPRLTIPPGWQPAQLPGEGFRPRRGDWGSRWRGSAWLMGQTPAGVAKE